MGVKEYSLVSIVVPCYNSQDTVIQTLMSVVKQTYGNIEVIVVDDGSTDNTSQVVRDYIAKYTYISLYHQENKGLPAARNYGFHYAKGEYVVFLDSDDLLGESFVYECLHKFYTDDSLSVVYTLTEFFERRTGICVLPELSMSRLLIQNCLTATAMIKSELLRNVGMYDENLKFMEDWELWIRLFSRYPNAYKIEKPLFYYRRRNSNNSMTDLNAVSNIAEKAVQYIYQKHYPLYHQYGYGMDKLLKAQVEALKYKEKYYNVWYRKLFYTIKRWFKK